MELVMIPKPLIAQSFARGLLYLLILATPFSIAAIEITFPIILLCWIMGWLLNKSSPSVWSTPAGEKIVFALLSYMAICTWSIAQSSYPAHSLDGLIGKTFEYALMFLIVADVAASAAVFGRSVRLLYWTGFFVCVYALLQQGLGMLSLQMDDQELQGHFFQFGRMVGPYKNPNGLATYLMVVFAVLSTSWFASKKRIAPFEWVIGTLLLGCLLAIGSKGALLGLLVSYVLLLAFGLSRKTIIRIGLAGAGIAIGFVAIRTGSIKYWITLSDAGSRERGVMWGTAWNMIRAHPIFGHGLNTFMANYMAFATGPNEGPAYAHNCYLQILAEIGIVGLLAFLWFMCTLFSTCWRTIKSSESHFEAMRGSLLGVLAGLLAFFVQAAFDTNFYALRQAALFWTLAGVGVGGALAYSKNPAPVTNSIHLHPTSPVSV